MARKTNSKKVTVEVTERDIRRGITADPRSCPIALALKRATRKKNVAVFNEDADLRNNDRDWLTEWSAKMPRRATRFVDQFDKGYTVKPIKFNLTFKRVR